MYERLNSGELYQLDEEEIESDEDFRRSIHKVIVSNNKNSDLKLKISYRSNILIFIFCLIIYFIYVFLLQSQN